MSETSTFSEGRGRRESGFALILAILALLLLTFLGLTLAATSSTELQIATNYRWSQQALYNAEAGLEAAKVALARIGIGGTLWAGILPAARTATPWSPISPPAKPTGTGRDYAPATGCTGDRGGLGYGLVLSEGTTRYEDASAFDGQPLNGNFTIWVRRPLNVNNAGLFTDETAHDQVIVTAEGVAPYSGAGTAFTRANQAVRVLEITFVLDNTTTGSPCTNLSGQAGLGPSGDNSDPCAVLQGGAGVMAALPADGTGGTGAAQGANVQ